jgi:hypothetical protein
MRTTLLLSALASAALVIACSAADKRSGFEPGPDPNALTDGGGPSLGEVKDTGPTKCATATAAAVKPPIDIIIVVDQSGSMSEELASVKANINTMSTLLDKAGIDYHVVMIGTVGTGTYDICVPPPLGGPNCGSNGKKYRAVNEHIESNDALTLVLKTLDSPPGSPTAWRDFLRPEAEKIFIPVTDDDAKNASFQPLNPNQWDADLLAKGTGGTTSPLFGTDALRKYKFYPIAGAQDYPSEVKCSSAVNNSSVYLELAKMTGGEWFNVCSGAFAPVFTKIGSVLSAQSACEMTIPTPENGGELDPDKVNVRFTSSDGKTKTDLLQDKTKGCADGANGWQYSEDGTKILLCGEDCETARNDPGSRVDVEFGCQTKVK